MCTVHNVLKYLAHSFMLTSNLHHNAKVQHQQFLRGKMSSHDNHILSQRSISAVSLVIEESWSNKMQMKEQEIKANEMNTCTMQNEVQQTEVLCEN